MSVTDCSLSSIPDEILSLSSSAQLRVALYDNVVDAVTANKTPNRLALKPDLAAAPSSVSSSTQSSSSKESYLDIIARYPRTPAFRYSYGTSGFRGRSETLPSVTARMAALAAFRSLTFGVSKRPDLPLCPITGCRLSQAVGIMVTASHNEEKDNGLKMIDVDGSMLQQEWEKIADELANEDEEKIGDHLRNLSTNFKVNINSPLRIVPHVFIGRDTRSSSPQLANILRQVLTAMGAHVSDYGIVTTPQLHWVLSNYNSFQPSTVNVYYQTLADSFQSIAGGSLLPSLIDCANGVGSLSLSHLSPMISNTIQFRLINADTSDTNHLNDGCGAEHVQKTRSLPSNFPLDAEGMKCISIDGDADRVVFFYRNKNGQTRLLDGDKMIVLYALYIKELLEQAGVTVTSSPDVSASSPSTLSIGVVQTAYANGASTHYISSSLALQIECTPTGVKHLHHAAHRYDVGIYFESNGHGTVLFSNKAKQLIKSIVDSGDEKNKSAALRVVSLFSLINQCTGDAVSDLLLVELALHHKQWTISDWDGLYQDLPSTMLKVKVADRSAVKTYDAERRCSAPEGLQDAIDAAVKNAPNESTAQFRRAFVRPSGTEDVVRIYAEASTVEEVKQLAKEVSDAVMKFAHGIS